jgi:hypothetical protein
VWHLRDLAAGKRTRITCKESQRMQLPHYDGLTIDAILNYARVVGGARVMKALPEEESEINHLPRNYIASVIYTLVGQPFSDWVD